MDENDVEKVIKQLSTSPDWALKSFLSPHDYEAWEAFKRLRDYFRRKNGEDID